MILDTRINSLCECEWSLIDLDFQTAQRHLDSLVSTKQRLIGHLPESGLERRHPDSVTAIVGRLERFEDGSRLLTLYSD